jgi:tetratricopeptide (TPR) repeat protein
VPAVAQEDPGKAVWSLLEQGQSDAAQALCSERVAQGQASALLLHAAGMFALQNKQAASASALLERALGLDRRNARTHYLLGRARRALGDLAGAAAAYRSALALEPQFWEVWVSLGSAERAQGRVAESIVALKRAVAIQPRALEAHLNLANALFSAGQSEAAVESYRAALSLNPNHPGALRGLMVTHAQCFLEVQRWDDARIAYERACERYPEAAIAHVGLGVARWNLGLLAEADAAFRTALALQPDDLAATLHIATLLNHRGLWTESLAWFERLQVMSPDDPAVMNGYAAALINVERLDEATALLERCLQQHPDFLMAQYNRGMLHLFAGEYRLGYVGYEQRFLPGILWRDGRPVMGAPAWQGESLHRRHLLVWAEQGMGDTVQYARYLPAIAARVAAEGGRLSCVVQQSLLPLMRDSFPSLDLRSDSDGPVEGIDFECPIMSLPLRLGMEEDFLAAQLPVLQVAPTACAGWQSRLGAARSLRIGLAWAGNPGQARNRQRSIPLSALLPLLELDAEFHVLQKGDAALAELDLPELRDHPAVARLQRSSDQCTDFRDTAALMCTLDLVITVDTSVAHVAAGLGCQTWILLNHLPDWRYGLTGERCVWYPDTPLLRQHATDDWTSVVTEACARLAMLLAARTGAPA